ncbi:MAG: ABC transporter permease subunit [Mycoplasma sp.]|nr:ABC transporter permease subunit [Candidatus Hennigella equi]
MKKILNKAPSAKRRRGRSETAAKAVTAAFSVLFLVLFLGVIAFIIYGSIPGWQKYGFVNIFGTSVYDLENGKAGAWLPLCITVMVAGLAIIIAAPVGIKTATFIKFRIPDKARRYVKMGVELLADIPTVVFGLFAITALGPVLKVIFNMPSAYNLITTAFMLAFLMMPTVVSLTLSALDSVDDSFLVCPMSMGNTKTGAIYKVYKKKIRGKVVIAVITALARGLGETMGVSMILQSQNYNQVFSNGFGAVWTSYLRTIGGLIAGNMFAESASESLRGLLFVYGLFLFIVVVLFNAIVKIIFREKKTTKQNIVLHTIGEGLKFIPRQLRKLWNKILNHKRVTVDVKENNVEKTLPKYFNQRAAIVRTNSNFYEGWKLFWEIFCFSLMFAFVGWMFITLIIKGIAGVTAPTQTVFQFGRDTTGQAFVNTLLVIVVSVGIGFVIALAVAIFINEFMPEGKMKNGFMFFIDSLGATPSIIYGMFGMIFFLQLLGISSGGNSGKSLLAGALTLIFVILPAFTRTNLQALQVVPVEVKQASYALGVGKWETCRKIVLPAAFQHILTGVVLAVGRVLAETAPLYLTAGLSGGSKISLMSAGQTLTTRIYSQINSNNVVAAQNIMYECAFVTLILIILILITVDIIIPKYFDHKKKKQSSEGINLIKSKGGFKQRSIDSARNLMVRAKLFYNLNF